MLSALTPSLFHCEAGQTHTMGLMAQTRVEVSSNHPAVSTEQAPESLP